MFYRVAELDTHEPSGMAYVLAHYWRSRAAHDRGEPPARINDFLLQLPPAQVERIVRDSHGFFLTRGGTAIDPADLDAITGIENWQRETVAVDRRARIERAVDAYWWEAEAEGYPRDQSDRRIKRSSRDPNGVLAEARSMVGEGRLVR